MEDYNELIRLQEIAIERIAPEKSGEPFLVEDFCAQVAWMKKDCPVYPYAQSEPEKVCKFLIGENKNYRCPACVDVELIYSPIFEKGNEVQKRALENLADMSVKYCVHTPETLKREIHPDVILISFSDAIRIYERLGLIQKSESARRLFKQKYTVITTEEDLRAIKEWKKQDEIDNQSKFKSTMLN